MTDKASLIAFWEECARDPQKRVFFHRHFGEYLKTLPDTPLEGQKSPQDGPKAGNWTDDQREAFHVGCTELANYFTAHGLDMKAVLRHDVDIPWTKDTVKEFIFRPIMKAMFGYTSHTQLKKGEVSKLWDVAMKHLGERRYQNRQGEEVVIEHMDFPHDPEKGNDKLKGIELAKKMPDYPVDEYPEGPTF